MKQITDDITNKKETCSIVNGLLLTYDPTEWFCISDCDLLKIQFKGINKKTFEPGLYEHLTIENKRYIKNIKTGKLYEYK